MTTTRSLEDRRTLITVLGVPFKLTSQSWLFPIAFTALGGAASAVVGWFTPLPATGPEMGLRGLLYGVLLMFSYGLHTTGHIIGGRLAGAPMDANLIMAWRQLNLYLDEGKTITPRQHLLRALGGPVLNIVIGVPALIAGLVLGSHLALALSFFNLSIALFSFVPHPHLDGGVILKVLRGEMS